MKFFVTLVPCCQSTKSVCHGCTTKNSTQFLPISEVFSNCVKHSLPERLNNILPDIHTGLSVFRCWTSARCTRDRPCPPCSGWRSGAGLPAGTSPTSGQGGPLLSRASQDLCYGASHKKWNFKKNHAPRRSETAPCSTNWHIYGKIMPDIFLLLLLVGTTLSPLLQKFFALSREGQYFYQDIAYCKILGLALSFAKTKGSMLGRT